MLNALVNTVSLVGPILLFFIALVVLKKRVVYFYYFIAGVFLNIILNIGLKLAIRDPRPLVDKAVLQYLEEHGGTWDYGFFGMPSLHAQLALYTTTFIILLVGTQATDRNFVPIILFCFAISCIVMWQQVFNKYHTVLQVVIGGVLGIIMGGLVFYGAAKQVQGIQGNRKDDFSFFTNGFAY
jgi:membrane-associated phospholipid phosphatase